MHNTLENSFNHFYNVLADVPNFFQIVGGHVAELKISTNDGYRTMPSQKPFDTGHFDFYEQQEINWVERISNTFEIKNKL